MIKSSRKRELFQLTVESGKLKVKSYGIASGND